MPVKCSVRSSDVASYVLGLFETVLPSLTDIDPPGAFEEVESTETSLSVRWQKPQAKVSGYRLVYVSKDGQVEEVEIPAAATGHVLPELTPGMSYALTLTAERGHKRSAPVTLTVSTGGWGIAVSHSEPRINDNTSLKRFVSAFTLINHLRMIVFFL